MDSHSDIASERRAKIGKLSTGVDRFATRLKSVPVTHVSDNSYGAHGSMKPRRSFRLPQLFPALSLPTAARRISMQRAVGAVVRVAAWLSLSALTTVGPPYANPQALGAEPMRPPAAMVWIPAGRLRLGSTYSELAEVAAHCNRAVGRPVCDPEDFDAELDRGEPRWVDGFWLDRTEVSVAAYRRCQVAGGCTTKSTGTGDPAMPVTHVSFEQAHDYCRFVKKRLPSEAEFELAAGGPDKRRYPWGRLFHHGRVNGGSWGPARTDAGDGFELTAPVESFFDGRSPRGILNLVGNVAEWTSTRYHEYGSDMTDGRRVVRGGHFASPPWQLRAAFRQPRRGSERAPTLGFRCARSATTEGASDP